MVFCCDRFAIEANNLARSKGLIGTRAYDENDWHDCKEMWYGLHNNDIFAIAMTTLEMYHCADYVGVNGSLFHCSEKQIKAIFARYNGTDEEETASFVIFIAHQKHIVFALKKLSYLNLPFLHISYL